MNLQIREACFNSILRHYTTGVRLNVEFTFSNFRPMSYGNPFHFEPQASMRVRANSAGSFVAGLCRFTPGFHLLSGTFSS